MENPQNKNIIYKPNPGTRYTVESSTVILINTQTGNKLVLEYPQAAIWDLMIKNYSTDIIVKMISNIVLITRAQAKSIILDTLESLCEKGFILKSENG